jgi:hypothetical protein
MCLHRIEGVQELTLQGYTQSPESHPKMLFLTHLYQNLELSDRITWELKFRITRFYEAHLLRNIFFLKRSAQETPSVETSNDRKKRKLGVQKGLLLGCLRGKGSEEMGQAPLQQHLETCAEDLLLPISHLTGSSF